MTWLVILLLIIVGAFMYPKLRCPKKNLGEILTSWGEMVGRIAPRYGMDPHYVLAVIAQESSGRAGVINDDDPNPELWSYGLMQLTERTARALGFQGIIGELLEDPELNIEFGCKLLKELVQVNNIKDPQEIYAAYNAGPDRPFPSVSMRRGLCVVMYFSELKRLASWRSPV
jgi:soluble lytic murein transglycosylase-like protein